MQILLLIMRRSCLDEIYIRDIADRPILRAAIQSKADVILTGDKDFLESGVMNPRIMTAAEFVGN